MRDILIFLEVQTRYFQIGKQIELGPVEFDRYDDEVKKCELITNNSGNKATTLYPYPKSYDARYSVTSYDGCKIYVQKATEKDEGTWTVQATILKAKTNKEDVVSVKHNIKLRKV